MKQSFKKFSLIAITILSTFTIIYSSNEESQEAMITQHQKEKNEQRIEEFEQNITEVRNETQQIGFCAQQLTQRLIANKIKISEEQKEKIIYELSQIQFLIETLLKDILVQTDPNIIIPGLVLNDIIASHLLIATSTNISIINFNKIDNSIKNCLKKSIKQENQKLIDIMIEKNQKTITKLINNTDFIGMTWYNKSYLYLKEHDNGYTRGAGVILFSTFIAACIYQSYFNYDNNGEGIINSYLNKIIGKPGQLITDKFRDDDGNTIERARRDPKTDELVKSPGTGFLKILDILKSAHRYQLIGFAPLFTSNLKEIASGIYYKYWLDAKIKTDKIIKRFDNVLAGTEKKHDIDDCEKVYFSDMTGAQGLEDLAKRITNYLMHPERYERSQTEEHRGILLYGPPQTGKTLFAKALKTMIEENIGQNQKITFLDVKRILDKNPGATIDEVFELAKEVSPCIMFFDELDLVGSHREKCPFNTGQLLTNMQGIDMASNKIFVIGATNRPEQLDHALIIDGRFGKIIPIDYPSYQDRKSYLEKQLSKRSIKIDPVFIDYMAQETNGASYNKLKRLITEALLLSTLSLRPVSQEDFEKTLDTEIRKIQNFSTEISLKEKRIIATHQAGKALMRHLLNTNQEVVKITILPVSKNVKTNEYGWAFKTDQNNKSDNDKLAEQQKEQKSKDGEVFTKTSTNNSTLISDEESKNEAKCLLAGQVALKIIFNESYSQCNPQDRADAMQIIYSIISQGESIDKILKIKALEIKEAYEKEIDKMLTKNKDILEKIINKLVECNSINRYEWKELIVDTK